MKPLSQRQLKVGEEIRHILSQILTRGECSDPLLDEMMIAISEVRVSSDLKHSFVYISPLGGGSEEESIRLLMHNLGKIRKILASRTALKFTPKIHFKTDSTFDEAEKINLLLKDPAVAKDLLE